MLRILPVIHITQTYIMLRILPVIHITHTYIKLRILHIIHITHTYIMLRILPVIHITHTYIMLKILPIIHVTHTFIMLRILPTLYTLTYTLCQGYSLLHTTYTHRYIMLSILSIIHITHTYIMLRILPTIHTLTLLYSSLCQGYLLLYINWHLYYVKDTPIINTLTHILCYGYSLLYNIHISITSRILPTIYYIHSQVLYVNDTPYCIYTNTLCQRYSHIHYAMNTPYHTTNCVDHLTYFIWEVQRYPHPRQLCKLWTLQIWAGCWTYFVC